MHVNRNRKVDNKTKQLQHIIHPFWDKRLTPLGAKFMIQYGKREVASIFFLQGIFWNQNLHNKLQVGQRFTIAKDKRGPLSEYSYKVMNSTILKVCPKCDKDIFENEDDDNIYIVSSKYSSGMLFKYKGITELYQ